MSTSASIYSLATEERTRAEASAWTRFSTARDQTEFCIGWLAILCGQIERVSGGVVLLGPDAEGSFSPAAIWPDHSHDLTHLGQAAQRVLTERRGIAVAADGQSSPTRDQPAHVGYPIEVSGVLHGAVVLDIAASTEVALQQALRQIHWASVWLVDRFRQKLLAEHDARSARMAVAMNLVATAMQERRFAPAALAVVNEMASHLGCDRVSAGFEKNGDVVVEAISNTAVFDGRMSLVRLIGEAMEEVIDLDEVLLWPPRAGEEMRAVAHVALASQLNDVAVCSVPLLEDGHPIGVLTLERNAGDAFDDDTVELCKLAGGMLGPILSLKRENERGTLERMRGGLHDGAIMLFGPRHPGVKLLAVLAVSLGTFLSVATGTYRVPARTVVEGAVQRAVVAPFDGHIAQSGVRAGDVVQTGQVLVRLEARDLQLERARLQAEREQSVRKQRQALSTLDRGTLAILAAQIAQSDAQISLLDDKIARATLLAPFDGVVVSGDLSQLLGTPVEQGKLLFQIAPLNAYRVVLEVDERDIARVEPGQAGDLILSGLSSERLPFVVQQITPVASQADGRNFFRVEAHLQTSVDRLRPGMEGVGKITVGQNKLLWIWTHSLSDWLSTWAWKEMP